MKKVSIIFLIIGLVCTPFLTISNGWIYALAMEALALGFGIPALISLKNNKKKTWIGVCALLFTNLLGGIFYLCWDPAKVVTPAKNNNSDKTESN